MADGRVGNRRGADGRVVDRPEEVVADFVVVGGGAAGCVLAERLSADRRRSVVLLEAGGEPRGLAVRVPALIQKIDSGLNWLYPGEPDPSRGGRAEPWNCARVLGGGSVTNAMLWVRGNPADFDGWAADGCAGWDYARVLDDFRRTECFEDGPSRLRGGDGPVHVGRTRVRHPATEAFLAAAAAAGYPRLDDYNGAEQCGVSLAQVNQRRGLRDDVAHAVLGPARRRPNLTVVTGAVAHAVLFAGTRATAVRYRTAAGMRTVRAAREVVLAAGALASPKLLLLSGVGPAAELRAQGVPVVAECPAVGRGLVEHPAASVVAEVSVRTLNQELTPLRLLRHGLDFALRGRGPVTSTASHAVAFGRLVDDSGAGRPDHPVPDHELVFVAFGLSAGGDAEGGAGGALRRLSRRSGGRAEDRHQPAGDPLVTVHAVLLHPRGRGRVALRSADPEAPALVEHELLGDPADLAGLVRACRRARTVLRTPPMRDLVRQERRPGPATEDDEDWAGYLSAAAFRMNHPASTCRMGAGPTAVVDHRLRVHGVTGLRVADASVMPAIPSGNTQAPTIMIAERAAGLILADHG